MEENNGGKREYDVNVTEKAFIEQPRQTKFLAILQIVYSLAGLLVGVFFLAAGIILSLLKTDGNTSIKLSMAGFGADLKTTIPGIALSLFGIYCVWVSRFSFNIFSSKKK